MDQHMTEVEKKSCKLARLRMVLSDEVIVYVGHFANARKVVVVVVVVVVAGGFGGGEGKGVWKGGRG